jgi:hypothetical protein
MSAGHGWKSETDRGEFGRAVEYGVRAWREGPFIVQAYWRGQDLLITRAEGQSPAEVEAEINLRPTVSFCFLSDDCGFLDVWHPL